VPVFCTRDPERAIGLVHCSGRLTEQDFRDSASLAFGSLIFEPGLNRIVTLDAGTELHELDADALRRISEHIAAEEQRNGRSVQFRSVLVAVSDEQRVILTLYKAVWETLRLPGVELVIAATEMEAWELLAPPVGRRPEGK
jgi:hypothetical protein